MIDLGIFTKNEVGHYSVTYLWLIGNWTSIVLINSNYPQTTRFAALKFLVNRLLIK